jgi:hypothetical protein
MGLFQDPHQQVLTITTRALMTAIMEMLQNTARKSCKTMSSDTAILASRKDRSGKTA